MGMVIFQMKDFFGGAKPEKAKADILAFKEMLASYQLQNGTLPTSEQGLKVLWAKPTAEPIPEHWHGLLEEETLDPWGHSYVYRNPAGTIPTATTSSPWARTASPIPTTTSATGPTTSRPNRALLPRAPSPPRRSRRRWEGGAIH
ncbi:MAG: type II secretion system protein GspG [Verrucomicrobiota bacterium]